MNLLRPEPVDPAGAGIVDASVPVERGVEWLLAGRTLVVTDRYPTAVSLQTALQEALEPPAVDAGHGPRRAYRRRLREASGRLLVPVRRGRLLVERAPTVGLLAELYPERGRIHLPVREVQRLNRADEVFRRGVPLAVLGHALHPFYGTYVPSRTSHLELFATWLSGWEGERRRAIDVGTGSGVLALLLARAGFAEVVATDTNPNALHSLQLELARRPQPVRGVGGDLLAGERGPFDVIVFNPPWLHGTVEELLDQALYYEDPSVFERFFDQALEGLAPGGRIVVLFSDIGRLVQPDVPHPIEVELARGRLERVQKLRRKVKGARTERGRRRTKERVEVWELARTPEL